jgi:glycosyltransferase involved in cell wall biosynthesis
MDDSTSLSEGFGLPVLEAMACGTPVITSNTTSLPEVVGEAAILVNPYSTEEIGQAIEKIVDNHSLRQELITKGLKKAKKFSWEDAAKKTIEVYKEVLGQ